MTYRRVGRSGLKVSALGLGGWTTFGGSVKDPKAIGAILRAAWEAGVTFFDIADIYAKGEAERAMGAALKDFPRHRLVISTKLYWPMSDDPNDRGLSRKHVIESIDRSLRRIGTDYVDLYFCHRFDADTPIEETARAMDDLLRQGKVLYWGTSEWTGAQIREACAIADRRNLDRPACEQPQLNLLERRKFESDTQPAAADLGLGLVTWSPLASGLLTGKYDGGLPAGSRMEAIGWLREKVLTAENVERVRRLGPIADRLGCSRAVLAIAWALSRPGVSSVILGATSVEQLRENLRAHDAAPDEPALRELDRIFPPVP